MDKFVHVRLKVFLDVCIFLKIGVVLEREKLALRNLLCCWVLSFIE